MAHLDTEHLRVLVANERKDRVALVAPLVAKLGHEVIDLIDKTVREAAWPALVVIHSPAVATAVVDGHRLLPRHPAG